MTVQEIYNDLNQEWWVIASIAGNTIPEATIYFKTEDGDYAQYSSTGVLDYKRDSTDVNNYVSEYLMWECARQLENGGCIGSISNIKPQSFQVFPIYFK